MIRPGVPAPNLAPRMGQEVVRERSGVVYRELRARSLVNRCDSPRVPFEWTVNPYRGCAMGCRYCYAAYTHEYLGLQPADSFHTAIYAKTFDLEETTRRLITTARRGERVALGTATDPYQPGEAELRVTAASSSARHRCAACGSASPPRAPSCCATSTCCSASTGARGCRSRSRSTRSTPSC